MVSLEYASKWKKTKLEKLLRRKINEFSIKTEGLNFSKKPTEKKIKEIPPQTDNENKIENFDFYYISRLSNSLQNKKIELKQMSEEGKGFCYEYEEKEKSSIEGDEESRFYNHYHHCLQSIAYITSLSPISNDKISEKTIYLPPRKTKKMKTLVLDLDETLVHCTENLDFPGDIQIPIRFSNGEKVPCSVSIRPNAINFLKAMSKLFEIVIFSASHRNYANEILNLLDPKNEYITYRIFRENCIETEEGIFVKDLRIFGNRKIDEIVIVDNACYSYAHQISNGIPIVPYFRGKTDTELLKLAGFLSGIAIQRNSSPDYFFKKVGDVEELSEESDMEEDDNEEEIGFKFEEEMTYYDFCTNVYDDFLLYFEVFERRFSKKDGVCVKIGDYFRGDVYFEYVEEYGERAAEMIADFLVDFYEEMKVD